jgi:hypothetical protein
MTLILNAEHTEQVTTDQEQHEEVMQLNAA